MTAIAPEATATAADVIPKLSVEPLPIVVSYVNSTKQPQYKNLQE